MTQFIDDDNNGTPYFLEGYKNEGGIYVKVVELTKDLKDSIEEHYKNNKQKKKK